MSEWWTYSLSSFLLFSPHTYHRLFELMNAELWPVQFVALAAGATLLVLVWRGRAARVGAWLLAAAWCAVGGVFFLHHYASINWAAPALGAAFFVQAALLAGAGVRTRPATPAPAAACALLLFGLVLQPLVGPLLGRPWRQVELFGIAPDPTVTLTLAWLAAAPARRGQVLWWVLPIAWCAATAATAWTMGDADWWLMPAVAAAAAAAAVVWRVPRRAVAPARSPAPPAAPAAASRPGRR